MSDESIAWKTQLLTLTQQLQIDRPTLPELRLLTVEWPDNDDCQLWSRWRRAEQFIQKNGDVFPIKNDDGTIKYLQQFPQVGIANNLASKLNRLEAEFGLTPSSRSRIRVEKGAAIA